MAPHESGTRSCRRTFRGVTIYHRFALQQRSQTMRWLMPERTLYAAILVLVGLVVTGIPGYGTADPPIAPPSDALQNTTPSGFPPCPDPMPSTMPRSADSTRPPVIDPSMLVPSGDIPCNASNLGVRSDTPGAPPPAPAVPACSPEECERMLDKRAKQIFEDRDTFNRLDDQSKQMIEDRVKQRNLTR